LVLDVLPNFKLDEVVEKTFWKVHYTAVTLFGVDIDRAYVYIYICNDLLRCLHENTCTPVDPSLNRQEGVAMITPPRSGVSDLSIHTQKPNTLPNVWNEIEAGRRCCIRWYFRK